MRVGGSFDPNEKTTSGVGDAGYIVADEPINFTIFFENDPAHGATAPVQELLITDQLSTTLDWSTLELTAMQIGSRVVEVPAGHSVFSTTLSLTSDPYPLAVDVTFDQVTGQLRWHLASQDRVTRALPDDPFAGFLPVNDLTGRGQGYVSYRVRPRAGLPDGTRILNRATITFDPTYGVNPPIVTNQVTNTLDLLAPTSSVQPLQATVPASFDVQWAGTDGTGSGITGYDVFVSIDGAPFTLWLGSSVATSATYQGSTEHTYGFYSVATDALGHREPVPQQAQATTRTTTTRKIYLPAIRR